MQRFGQLGGLFQARAGAQLVAQAVFGGHDLAPAQVQAAFGSRFNRFHAMAGVELPRLVVEYIPFKSQLILGIGRRIFSGAA